MLFLHLFVVFMEVYFTCHYVMCINHTQCLSHKLVCSANVKITERIKTLEAAINWSECEFYRIVCMFK